MNDFTYHRPTSLSEAVTLLRDNPEAKALAGGQSLMPLMKLALAAPSDVVSLADVPGLDEIARDGDALTVGAGVTHTAVAESDVVAAAIPALADLAGQIGDPQVRNRGTLGGALSHADPASDYPAAVLALDATVVTDRREIPADDFFVTMFTTALERDELIRSVRFRVPDEAAYAKFAHPASRFAVVGVMVARHGDDVRVGVTGAAPAAFRATSMEQALTADFRPDAIASEAVDSGTLIDDDAGSAEYRAHLVGVLARRAVEACA